MKLKSRSAFALGFIAGVCLTVVGLILFAIVLYFAIVQPASERKIIQQQLSELSFPTVQDVAGEKADPSVREIVTALGEAYLERPENVGVVIGTVIDGKREIVALGQDSRNADAQPVDGKTLFEIGSISKPLTGVLLAEAVRRGELKLEDPLASAMSKDVRIPKVDGEDITFRHLATHTSGLPRVPPTIQVWRAAAYDLLLTYPYEGLEAAEQDRALTMVADTTASLPGKYSYSNFAFTLLARALVARAGLPYDQLFHTRLAQPLGLKQTGSGYPAPEQGRMAVGYSGGQESASWVAGPIRGAGGVVSSAEDMLTILQAHLQPESTPLAESIKLALTPQAEQKEKGVKTGLGWMIARQNGGFWHNGATGGFCSYAAFQPQSGVAVVVLSNSTDGAVNPLGLRIIRMLHAKAVARDQVDKSP